MRKYFLFLLSAIIVIALSFACGGGSDNGPIAVTGITLNKTTLTLTSGQQETLEAIIEPENATNKNVTWRSSNDNNAMVSPGGIVTALVPGDAIIFASTEDGGKTALCTLTVQSTQIAVTGITLNKTELLLTSGDQETLTATVAPDNATNKAVAWTSSDTRLAQVSQNGVVTALNPGGPVAIVASTADGGKMAVCNLTVAPSTVINVTGVSLDRTILTIAVGDTETLEATVRPANATNKGVTWFSSNTAIAQVAQNGAVTGISPGDAIIFASTHDGNFSANCNLRVTYNTVPTTGITLDKDELTLLVMQDGTLTATVLPSNATNKNITWTSSDLTVATVSQTGIVTALKPGRTLIIAVTQEGGWVATCNVNVYETNIPVTEIRLNKNTLTLAKGYAEQLFATVLPENATNKRVSWSSQHTNIAAVDPDNGMVTALNPGNTTIVATASNGLAAICEVEVVLSNEPVSGVTLDQGEMELAVGASKQLTATIWPDTATNKSVNWFTSCNGSIATVSPTGVVTAVAPGNTVVIVTTVEGGKTAFCFLKVN